MILLLSMISMYDIYTHIAANYPEFFVRFTNLGPFTSCFTQNKFCLQKKNKKWTGVRLQEMHRKKYVQVLIVSVQDAYITGGYLLPTCLLSIIPKAGEVGVSTVALNVTVICKQYAACESLLLCRVCYCFYAACKAQSSLIKFLCFPQKMCSWGTVLKNACNSPPLSSGLQDFHEFNSSQV